MVGGDARDDLASFWLRKTKRPVLAVLLVQKKGGKPQLYRGTNMEVSEEENEGTVLLYAATKHMLFLERSLSTSRANC